MRYCVYCAGVGSSYLNLVYCAGVGPSYLNPLFLELLPGAELSWVHERVGTYVTRWCLM